MLKRKEIIVAGQVQGVGFRPFVYTLAQKYSLVGSVLNSREGVFIEVEGLAENIKNFEFSLQNELPPLAKITSFISSDKELKKKENEFTIIMSDTKGKGHAVLISPDVAHCEECKKEMLDNNDKNRYLYPFINCTHCGPRFSITHSMPYDRITTSMACFPLCDDCQKEYTNPLDRRFHAQPTACNFCGVQTWTEDNKKNFDSIKNTIEKLHNGKIIAIKGLGGFHLACDAFNLESISTLRLRKNRPHKALAIMVKNIETAKELAKINNEEEKLLTSRQRPIVLCKKIPNALPDLLSPDTDTIGIMLPSSPLHELLFNGKHFNIEKEDFKALVMTSGNPAHEPICLKNREAAKKLSSIADAFLFHNRDILVRVDDSVLFAKDEAIKKLDDSENPIISIRRARGYVPTPLELPHINQGKTKNILAFGADLKGTCCIAKQGKDKTIAFVGQHVGDIESMKNQEFLLETIEHLSKILDVSPDIVVADAHPNAFSRLLAEEYATQKNIECINLQHHAAHAFSLLADNHELEPCLSLVLDGTGYGLDNTIWGGELLYIEPQKAQWHRIGHFKKTLQVANDRAVQKPFYMTQSFLHSINKKYIMKGIDEFEQNAIQELCDKNMGIHTSSCGRLFDAVGVLLGCVSEISYEGQVPVQLEAMQDFTYSDFDVFESYKENNMEVFDSHALFKKCFNMKIANINNNKIARYFHLSLAQSLAFYVMKAAKELKIKKIGLSGGVLLNKSLCKDLSLILLKHGFDVLLHKSYSPSDASLSLGQAFFSSLKN